MNRILEILSRKEELAYVIVTISAYFYYILATYISVDLAIDQENAPFRITFFKPSAKLYVQQYYQVSWFLELKEAWAWSSQICQPMSQSNTRLEDTRRDWCKWKARRLKANLIGRNTWLVKECSRLLFSSRLNFQQEQRERFLEGLSFNVRGSHIVKSPEITQN